MQTDDVSIRVQVQDGTWETFGVDRAIQVVPESVSLTANENGSDTASFDLHRDPSAIWPDLQASNSLEVEVGGVLVWAGRIKNTPAHDGEDPAINVQAEGWQYHLDDDVYAKAYVHSTISEWRDARSWPSVNLVSQFSTQGAGVTVDGGSVVLTWPQGTTIVSNGEWGVILDLGPYNTAAGISIDWLSSNNTANWSMYCRTMVDPGSILASLSSGSVQNNAGASGTLHGTFTPTGRYVEIVGHNNTGLSTTAGADSWFKLTGIRVFTNDTWRSTDASVLHAKDVIIDTVQCSTSKLSTDISRVATTSFAIPDLHFGFEPRTPREIWDGVNALHNYITQVDVYKRPVFQPRPPAPLFEIGSWGGATFDDSNANSIQDVYTRVLLTGTGPDGSPMIYERSIGGLTSTALSPTASPVPDNPSFATNTTSWSTAIGGLTQNGGAGYNGVAGFGAWASTPGDVLTETFTGTFVAGTTYVLQFAYKSTRTNSVVTAQLGNFNGFQPVDIGQTQILPTNVFTLYTVTWTPCATINGAKFNLIPASTVPISNLAESIDALTLSTARPSIISKAGYRHTKILPIQAAFTATVANQIGDVFLLAHQTQPLQGGMTVSPGGVRRVLTGEDVHPAHLLLNTQQLVRLGHRIDPDTGGVGRDGTIATVSYDHATRTSSVTIDSTRKNFEVLLERFALLSPQ